MLSAHSLTRRSECGTISLASSSSACVTADLGAQLYVLDQVNFGACPGGHITVTNAGRIYLLNNYVINGNALRTFSDPERWHYNHPSQRCSSRLAQTSRYLSLQLRGRVASF
jgi:hypothetical protein